MGFEPAGDKAQWLLIYELMARAEIGQVVTYPEMGAALDLDPRSERHAIQCAARRAGLELERIDKRAAIAVRNEGYRIAEPAEHLMLGRRRARRAGTQVRRGELVTTNVDLNGVDTQTRAALETLARGFAVQGEVNRRILAKQQQHDDLIGMLLRGQETLAQRVEKLEKDQ